MAACLYAAMTQHQVRGTYLSNVLRVQAGKGLLDVCKEHPAAHDQKKYIPKVLNMCKHEEEVIKHPQR